MRGGWDRAAPATAPEARATQASRPARVGVTASPPRPGAGLRIRGTVVDTHGAPVAGARVSASWPEPAQTLSEQPCPEGSHAPYEDPRDPRIQGRTLSDCMAWAADFVMGWVGAREGEAPVYAEATTGEDGAFVLEGLPEGPQALWAFSEDGAVMRPGIPAGTDGVELVLEPGTWAEGLVLGEGAPLAEALVTVLDAGHTRFFDATTGADGRFRVGPLPDLGSWYVFIAKEGWHPAFLDAGSKVKVTLHRPSQLSGRVLSGGVPAPGAEVRVAPGDALPGDDAHRLTADLEGRFSLELPSGAYTLSASLGGRYALARVAEGAASEVVLELGSAPHVEGTVSDDAGRPVAGATVEGTPDTHTGLYLKALTGADGRYHLGPVEPGDWSFAVTAPGYLDLNHSRERDRLLGPGMGRLDFTLVRAASVTGRITDSEGHPAAGLELSFRRAHRSDDPDDSMAQEGTQTDEDGRFVLDAEEPGDYRIEVDDTRYLGAVFSVHAPAQDVHLTLQSGASVSGTVVDARGLPLQDFWVELQDAEGEHELSLGRRAFTDTKGRFRLQGVKPGRYVVLASRETDGLTRRAWRVVELAVGATPEVELRMEPERTLSGIVVDTAGQPLAEAYVRVRPPQEDGPVWKREGRHAHHGPPLGTPTGPDGRFTLRGLTEATYDLSLFKDGYTLDHQRSSGGEFAREDLLRVVAGVAEVRMVLERDPHIVGRVVGPEGEPVARFNVNRLAMKDPKGAFAVPLYNLGPRDLVLEAEGLATRVLRVEPRPGGADLDVGVVRLSRGRTLRGQVVDAETSEPVRFAFLNLTTRTANADGHTVTLPSQVTDEHGAFALPNVDLEAFTLTVRADDYHPQAVTPGPEQEALTVRLDPGARVEVRVVDSQGRLVAARIDLHDDAGQEATAALAKKGQHVFQGLVPGPYTVRVDATGLGHRPVPDFLPHRVVVPASGRVSLTVQAQEGGATVTVRVPVDDSESMLLLPGSVPVPTRYAVLQGLRPRSLPVQQVARGATFHHVPAGRATLFLVREGLATFHREELDIPAGGEVSFQPHPVWRPFDSGPQ